MFYLSQLDDCPLFVQPVGECIARGRLITKASVCHAVVANPCSFLFFMRKGEPSSSSFSRPILRGVFFRLVSFSRMFSTAQTLVGVAKIPPSGLSRCFFLDLRPYQTKRKNAPETFPPAIEDARTPQYHRREHEDEASPLLYRRQEEEEENTSVSTLGKLTQSLSQTRRRISSSVGDDALYSSVSEEKKRTGIEGELEGRDREGHDMGANSVGRREVDMVGLPM